MKLSDYISGLRRGKEANRLEREALRDPFLQDALEGYDRLQEDPTPAIADLQKQIKKRSSHPKRNIYRISAAASLFILILGGTYLFFTIEKRDHPAMLSYEQELSGIVKKMPVPNQQQEEIVIEATPEIPVPPAATIPPRPEVNKEQILRKSQEEKSSTAMVLPSEPVFPPVMEPLARVDEEVEESIEYASASSAAEKERKTSSPVPIQKGTIYIADTGHVFGSVTDEQGEPIIGANVAIKGSNQGTITDIDGFFELHTEIGNEITIEFIGYEPLTIPVKEGSTLIAMHESTDSLDEVVVIGYGVQKKNAITGAISKIRGDKSKTGTPEPETGEKEYKKYIEENLIHPAGEGCKKKKGNVQLRFYINSYGRPVDIRVVKSLCEEADKEAIRLIEEGPDWTEGDKEVKYTIRF